MSRQNAALAATVSTTVGVINASSNNNDNNNSQNNNHNNNGSLNFYVERVRSTNNNRDLSSRGSLSSNNNNNNNNNIIVAWPQLTFYNGASGRGNVEAAADYYHSTLTAALVVTVVFACVALALIFAWQMFVISRCLNYLINNQTNK